MSLLSLTNCEKTVDGCMSQDAINYKADAETDDGSCSFEGSIVFWNDYGFSHAYQSLGVTHLTYYLNNKDLGTKAINEHLTEAPDCGQTGTISTTLIIGNANVMSLPFKLVDQDGNVQWESSLVLKANKCNKFELGEITNN